MEDEIYYYMFFALEKKEGCNCGIQKDREQHVIAITEKGYGHVKLGKSTETGYLLNFVVRVMFVGWKVVLIGGWKP